MATNYEALDAAILSALGERSRGFTEIYSGDAGDIAEATCRNGGGRALDRRLQSLRKRGLIRYAGCCWHLVATGGPLMATSERMADGAPVAGGGVLSVMNCAVIALDDYSMESKRQPSPTAASLRAAIQAVAELIAADKEYDEAEADLDDAIKSGGWSGETTLRCRDRVRDIRNRRAAALSNIEGGSK